MSIKSRILISVIAVLILSIGLIYYLENRRIFADVSNVSSASASVEITSKADWEAGTVTNADLNSSPGSLKKDDKTSGALDIKAIADEDNGRISASNSANMITMVTNGNTPNTNHDWPAPTSPPGDAWWIMDLGRSYYLNGVNSANDCSYYNDPGKPANFDGCPVGGPDGKYYRLSTSLDGVDYTVRQTGGPGMHAPGWCNELGTICYSNFDPTYVRYLKLESNYYGYDDVNHWYYGMDGLYARQASKITIHTTGATQIDGGENFWSWDGFTPTQTVPANTSVTYRYRTSPDGTSWTDWKSSIGAVTSRTGDANNPVKYRYLQVEVTLVNSDGASTPSVDSYDIDYHTEIKPNAPSAQTAVAQ